MTHPREQASETICSSYSLMSEEWLGDIIDGDFEVVLKSKK